MMKMWKKTVGAAVLAAVLCAMGTAQALSPRQAACYEQVTGALSASYGSARTDRNRGMSGFVLTTLADFDGDGTEELVCSFTYRENGIGRSLQKVWTYRNGEAVQLFENRITNFGTGVDPQVLLYKDSQKAYLVTGEELMNGGEEVYWTLQGGQWVAALRLVDALSFYPNGERGPDRYEINGKSVTPEELDAARAALTQGMQERSYHYFEQQSMIEAERNKTLQTLAQAARPVAAPSSAALRINGAPADAPAYLIAGSNYFRLRDVAALISGTEKQFAIDWNSGQNCITLTKGMPYASDVTAAPMKTAQASACMSSFVLDNAPLELAAYTIGGNNYVKLRDLAQALDFNVSWDAGEGCVTIDTSGAYTAQ